MHPIILILIVLLLLGCVGGWGYTAGGWTGYGPGGGVLGVVVIVVLILLVFGRL